MIRFLQKYTFFFFGQGGRKGAIENGPLDHLLVPQLILYMFCQDELETNTGNGLILPGFSYLVHFFESWYNISFVKKLSNEKGSCEP